MNWDFTEGNPFSDSSGNFLGQVEYLTNVVEVLGHGPPGIAAQQNAVQIKPQLSYVISTDPPYYDNIGYADLSDFFYVWLRPGLRETFPDQFNTVLVPKAQELVATAHRFDGDKEAANRFFETGLRKVFSALRHTQRDEFPLTVYYAFKQADAEDENKDGENSSASTGWETMLTSLIESGFVINGTWPMRTELLTALKRTVNALASSIVLVCRPRPADAPATTRRQFVDMLHRELPAALRELQSGNIAPVDLAQASIGPGMAIFSRYSRVLEADGTPLTVRDALALINQTLDAFLAEQDGAIDGETRFAVAWFEQHGFDTGDFGAADVLARAKNTSVQSVAGAGLVEAGRGKVRLIHWKEYPPGAWDPQTDRRPTVWEAVHHLIERLNTQGERGAGRLLAQINPEMAGEARSLAYRLYSICERKGWADDARDYNALVVQWADVQEMAGEAARQQIEQGRLQI